jgi:hypothetical protein
MDARRMNPISLARGVAEICHQVPFRVRVINTHDREVCLPRNMVIGHAEHQPEQILAVEDHSLSDILPESGLQGSASAGSTTPWEIEVDLAHLPPLERKAVLEMLSPHR